MGFGQVRSRGGSVGYLQQTIRLLSDAGVLRMTFVFDKSTFIRNKLMYKATSNFNDVRIKQMKNTVSFIHDNTLPFTLTGTATL
jgi:hypothetical protein